MTTPLAGSDRTCAASPYAPDEVGLALHLSRWSASARIEQSVELTERLPETLGLWQAGRLDERRVTAICDATRHLPVETARAVQQRVLPRAPEQALSQLRAALARAVIAAGPAGAEQRHRAARRERRVAVNPEPDGMAYGGGKAPQWADRFIGAENVARVVAALVPLLARIGAKVEPHQVNGQPGAIFRDRDGKVLNTWALDILNGQIQTIRTVNNSDKLGHLGPVADAWVALHEANQARRPTD
jgi:hypothetical protein